MEENYKRQANTLMENASVEYRKLEPRFGNIPVISSSRSALIEIEKLLRESSDYFIFREKVLQNPMLNVGLLAAKALDPISLFRGYANTLHRLWYFISPIHIPSFGSKQALAYYFYKQHGYKDARISSHFCGIDFYKPVYIKIIPSLIGIKVYQWKICEDKEQGDYYAEFKLADPDCLGVSALKKDSSGQSRNRNPHVFELKGQVEVLVSCAAPALDYWSLGWNEPVQTRGGCVQYFNHNNENYFIPEFCKGCI